MRLVSCIVQRGEGDKAAAAARSAGGEGGTILMGRGTASRTWLEMLGLGETQRDFALFLVADDAVAADIVKAVSASGDGPGVVFSVQASRFLKGGAGEVAEMAEDNVAQDHGRRLICAVLNKGFACDAMAAARKAGAKGGTIVNARGTANEDDARFFGVTLTPEKEMLMVVAEEDVSDAVFSAIGGLPCLADKGSGIVFALPVADVAVFGR